MAHDFDEEFTEIDEELPSYEDGPNENEEVDDFEKIGVEEFEPNVEVNNDKKELSNQSHSEAQLPNDNKIKNAFKTFEELTQLVFRLETLAAAAREENKELIALSNKNQVVFSKIDNNSKVLDNMQKLINSLNDLFLKTENIENILKDVPSTFASSFNVLKKELDKVILSLGKDINLKQISEDINKKIEDLITKNGLNAIEKNVNSLNYATNQIVDVSETLLGRKENNNLGLIREFEKVNSNLKTNLIEINKEINKYKNNSDFKMYFIIAFSSIFFTFIGSYFYFSKSYEEKFVNNIINKSEDIRRIYENRLETLEKENLIFQDFLKIHGTDKSKIGFAYFKDTGKPYLYFPSDMKSFNIKNTTYIPIN